LSMDANSKATLPRSGFVQQDNLTRTKNSWLSLRDFSPQF